MGFISNFYWIFGDKDAYIEFKSITKEEKFKVKLTYENNTFYAEYIKLNIIENERTGTEISVFKQKGIDLPFETISDKYILFKDIRIIKYDEEAKNSKRVRSFIKNINNKCILISEYDENKVVFKDFATGVSYNTLLNSMLVPTSSTKSSNISNNNLTKFDIENNLRICGVSVAGVLIYLTYTKDIGLTLNFDLSMKLAVDRKDILINNKEDKIKLINKLKELFAYCNNKKDRSLYINSLFFLLDNYKKHTTQKVIKSIIERLQNKFVKDNINDIIKVRNYFAIYNIIKDKIILEDENSDNINITMELLKHYKVEKEIGSKKIIVIEDYYMLKDNFETCDTINLIFIKKNYYKENIDKLHKEY